MNKGFIKLPRELMYWMWYTDGNVFRVFVHLLLNACFEDGEFYGEKICKGQLITGRRVLASELRLSESQVRTALEKLEASGDITIKSTNKYSVITIVNWDFLQNEEKFFTKKSQSNHHKKTNQSPHYKKEKNEKNEKKYSNARTREREHSSIDFSLLDLIINQD